MQNIHTTEELLDVLQQKQAIIFKHSTRCSLSAQAYQQMSAFAQQQLDVPLYVVHVIEDRPLSNAIAEKLGVQHQSPQVILLRSGKVTWSVSHTGVTQNDLLKAVQQ